MASRVTNHVSTGMLPNRFPDEGQAPKYNTVDATLWYFEATRAHRAATHLTYTRHYGLWDLYPFY